MKKPQIPYYNEINELLGKFTIARTKDPNCFCWKMPGKETLKKDIFVPPFRKSFYTIFIVKNAEKDRAFFENREVVNKSSYIFIQSPGLSVSYTYSKENQTTGYSLYFKSELFSFLKLDLEKEFSFFNYLNVGYLELEEKEYDFLMPFMEDIYQMTRAKRDEFAENVIALKVLIMLYQLKKFFRHKSLYDSSSIQNNDSTLNHFLQLINIHYLDKRTVKEYADLMKVSPNFLSKAIKQSTNKNALSFINERIIGEAKNYLTFSHYTISQITNLLNFSDVSNFVKFFKLHTGLTPARFKEQQQRYTIN